LFLGFIRPRAAPSSSLRFDGTGINLLLAAIHEIGHTLGLGDDDKDSSSIMFGKYRSLKQPSILPEVDRQSVIKLYGTRQSELQPANDLVVVLRNKQTGKVLDSNGMKNVYTMYRNFGLYQQWKLRRQDGGSYILQNEATAFVLDADTNKTYTHELNGGGFQNWRFHRFDDSTYLLQSLATSYVLDSHEGGSVYPHSRNDGAYQRWYLERSTSHYMQKD
jgi:hypothetical protein